MVVCTAASPPPRCTRCKAYRSPGLRWAAEGKKWHCGICGLGNDVTANEKAPLGADGQPRDAASRPDLAYGTVEYDVTALGDYVAGPLKAHLAARAAAAGSAGTSAVDASRCTDTAPTPTPSGGGGSAGGVPGSPLSSAGAAAAAVAFGSDAAPRRVFVLDATLDGLPHIAAVAGALSNMLREAADAAEAGDGGDGGDGDAGGSGGAIRGAYTLGPIAFVTFGHTVHTFHVVSEGSSRARVVAPSGSGNGTDFPPMRIICDVGNPFLPSSPTFYAATPAGARAAAAFLDALPSRLLSLATSDCQPAASAADAALRVAAMMCGGAAAAPFSGGRITAILASWPTASVDRPAASICDNIVAALAPYSASLDLVAISAVGIGAVGIDRCAAAARCLGGSVWDLDAPRMQAVHLLTPRLVSAFRRCLAFAPLATQAVVRVRVSRGLKVSATHGPYLRAGSTSTASGGAVTASPAELDVAGMDASTSFVFEVTHEDPSLPDTPAVLQLATLFTSHDGTRRIRVSTLRLPLVKAAVDLFRALDLDAALSYLMRLLLHNASVSNGVAGKPSRDPVAVATERLVALMAAYRKLVYGLAPSTLNRLVLPDSLKLLPCLTHAMLGTVVSGRASATGPSGASGATSSNAIRAFCRLMALESATSQQLAMFVYPHMVALHTWVTVMSSYVGVIDADAGVIMPPWEMAVTDKIQHSGLYLHVDPLALQITLWVGSAAHPAMLAACLRASVDATAGEIAARLLDGAAGISQPIDDDLLAPRVLAVVNELRRLVTGGSALGVALIKSGGRPEDEIRLADEAVVEVGKELLGWYGDYLMQLQQQIMSKLNVV